MAEEGRPKVIDAPSKPNLTRPSQAAAGNSAPSGDGGSGETGATRPATADAGSSAKRTTTTPVKGLFEFEDNKKDDQFNLKPRDDRSVSIPDDQRKISIEVYEVRNVLKLLQEQEIFDSNDPAYHEFMKRVLQAAEVGCVSPAADTTLAGAALDQIRADIVRRKGRHITYSYLLFLGLYALIGIVAAAAIVIASKFLPGLAGYGWVIMGSMAGAWLSVAAGRREVSFDGIPDFLNYGYEPLIRILFVGVLASVFALFLELKILSLTVAGFDLATFSTNISLALAIGVVAGIGERAMSVQLIARAQNVLSPGTR